MSIKIYSFYNNKGGVGKTTLCQNAATLYAEHNRNTQVLVLDLCPQANISQFLLGGGHAGYEQNQRIQSQSSRKNIVGFFDFLLKGNSGFKTIKRSYKLNVSNYNEHVTENLYLIAGDSFLESLSLALNYAVINPANINAWKEYMTAIRRLCFLEFDEHKYKDMVVFIDCNPSFSIYTQMALVSSDNLIIPMMADFSSLEGIKGLLMLLYGKYPSSALKKYAEDIVTFSKQVDNFGLKLPKLYEFVFNNFTVNLGVAKAYDSVRNELIEFCKQQHDEFPELFASLGDVSDIYSWSNKFVSNIKDFHTAGKVSATLGVPMHRLPRNSTYIMPDGELVKLPSKNYELALEQLEAFAYRI
ncbi:ParA family protein [Vibrio parahaemolyticus]|uniref:ParA family protein n=1 Tax=Vibrio parahaemolyticus TaxID=670 RepID=UPI001123EF58|nr:ParA family protein [Vibrio parahaemolyticus]TOH16457.1 ATPase [Vibrio parahaemolyticus]